MLKLLLLRSFGRSKVKMHKKRSQDAFLRVHVINMGIKEIREKRVSGNTKKYPCQAFFFSRETLQIPKDLVSFISVGMNTIESSLRPSEDHGGFRKAISRRSFHNILQ
jgi:hypothetical protein